jgi:hypothetical protein
MVVPDYDEGDTVHRARQALAFCLATVLLVAVLGCATGGPQFVAEDRTYTMSEALDLPARLDAGDLPDTDTNESASLRRAALVALRKQGGKAEEAARIITATFPPETAGVPFYVEQATYGTAPAIVMVEAIGPRGGKLVDRRVWVISPEGDVLLTGTR